MIDHTGRIVIELIESCGTVGSELREIVEKACVRTLDSRMIIEGELRDRDGKRDAAAAKGYPIGEIPDSGEIESIIEGTRREGIGPHFNSLITYFWVIIAMTSTAEKQKVEELLGLIRRGLKGCFLMTDRGGPSMNTWISQTIVKDDDHLLTIDKLHGMNAVQCDCAIVVVRNPGSFLPAVYGLKPEKYAGLEKHAAGDAWFDGHVQLGNVQGKVTLSSNEKLIGGGFAPVAKQLSICRPRLVRVALSHLQWLTGCGRLRLSGFHQQALADITALAEAQMRFDVISPYTLDRVHALKFSFNELLLDIVLSGAVSDLPDRRDLLGLTKMEGSSYRCFLEIMARRMVRK